MQTNNKSSAFTVSRGAFAVAADSQTPESARSNQSFYGISTNGHDKTKICFYNHTGSVSGAEKVLFSILCALDNEKYQGVVFAPQSQAFESICRSTNMAFHPVASLNARYTLNPAKLAIYLLSVARLLSELRTNIFRESPDLVHANTTRAAIVASLATIGTRIPVLWYMHDILPKHPLSTMVRILAVLSGRNRLIAVSNATANAFRGALPSWVQSRAPLEVIHNGTDTELFNTNRDGLPSLLEELGLNGNHFRIGIVGQITPRKGHLELIQTLAPIFKTSLPNGRLLVVGSAMFNNDKAYLELLKAEANRLGVQDQVMFLGTRHVPTLMKALNVLVLNSSTEPFGLVLTEAMASGTPVVARSVDGVLEIVEDNVSGLLFAPGDMKTLASHLLSLSRDAELVAKLARGGRARVETRFDQRICQAKVLERYASYSSSMPPQVGDLSNPRQAKSFAE
jgi:glycosyltransferase involved in cell wall biosynthesis